MDGILILDKPRGITSMEAVRRLKRASGQKRVGHGGTLDPIATGVVPIFFGQATRVMEYVLEGTKEYRGLIELGAATDTYDSAGDVTARSDASHVTAEDIVATLRSFQGKFHQVPPMYSALKRQGKRLYELARAGIEVEREPRLAEVSRIDLVDWTPPRATVRLECGRGFYMRSLAHDLGQKLGCGGHLTELVRLRSGTFHISAALSLDEAERVFAAGSGHEALQGPDAALGHLRAAILGKRLELLVRSGRALPAGLRIPYSKPDERCRAYSVDGGFMGILAFSAATGQWQPHKVFSMTYPEE